MFSSRITSRLTSLPSLKLAYNLNRIPARSLSSSRSLYSDTMKAVDTTKRLEGLRQLMRDRKLDVYSKIAQVICRIYQSLFSNRKLNSRAF